MKKIRIFFALLMVFMMMATTQCFAQNLKEAGAPMSEAVAAAEHWLKLADAGKYAESWDAGSLVLQQAIEKNKWVSVLEKSRAPLGTVRSRNLKLEIPAQAPAGMPSGAYMVIQYNTSFSLKPAAEELLTLYKEPKGQWKVSAYFVQ